MAIYIPAHARMKLPMNYSAFTKVKRVRQFRYKMREKNTEN